VAIEAPASGQAALQVDVAAGLPLAQIRLFQGLGNGRYGVGAPRLVESYYCETHAVVGHALVDFQLGRKGRLHGKMTVGAFVGYSYYGAQRFNYSSKHIFI
jgi:hypothetical protein